MNRPLKYSKIAAWWPLLVPVFLLTIEPTFAGMVCGYASATEGIEDTLPPHGNASYFGEETTIGSPYVLRDTRVLSFTSEDKSHSLRLFIALPRNYSARSDSFPVIYLLDADYSFALARNILLHFTDRDQLKEAIIVGIAYPGADSDLSFYKRTRTVDYTPSNTPKGGYSEEDQKVSGGGPNFLKILGDELLPFIDARFRTKPSRRMIVGHSFGGLFASYAMLTKPGFFHDYLIVSPSYWYDNRMMFTLAKRYIASHKALPAHVFYAIGSREGIMVDDVNAMDTLFKKAKLEGYYSSLQVFEGDTHNSVFPGALTRGLRVLIGHDGE